MIWGTVKPNLGETRTLESFALIPTQMSNGLWIWFEYYWDTQKYDYWGMDNMESPTRSWQSIERKLR